MDIEEFRRHIQSFAGCYAYSLGYNDGRTVHGLRLIPGDPMNISLPILADRPPPGVDSGDPGNSLNHGGLGQNVLFIDGHCGFRTVRTVGFEGDDIYVNFDRKVAAGKTRLDSVLASSDCKP
jgi:prepilin-type processing-associated H-X9-DG protein